MFNTNINDNSKNTGFFNNNTKYKNCNNIKKGSVNPEIISEIIENVLPIAIDAGVKIVSMIFNKRKE